MTDEQYTRICELLKVIISNQALILNQQNIALGRSVGMTSDEEIKALVNYTMKTLNTELDGLEKM